MSTVEDRIRTALIKYLAAEHNVDATNAGLTESEYEAAWGGCDTCGYGESPASISFDIWYKPAKPGSRSREYVTIHGDTLNFRPVLIKYIDETES